MSATLSRAVRTSTGVVIAALAGGLEDGEAIDLRQHEVEDDQIVGRGLQDEVERGGAVGGDLHGVALLGQPLPDEAGDLALVLDDQDPQGVPSYAFIFSLQGFDVHAEAGRRASAGEGRGAASGRYRG